MNAMTVLGAVETSVLGAVMMHEHLLHDDVPDPFWFKQNLDDATGDLANAPVTMDILGELWRSPRSNRDNNRLTGRDPVADELARYKRAGGGTVVELTSRGLTPNPQGLIEISRRSGVHVVAGTGYYVHESHPEYVEQATVDTLTAELVQDLTTGFAGSNVRAGIIGEMGVSTQLTAREEKTLRAAGRAAAHTGAAVMVHLEMTGDQALPAFKVLTSEGAAANRIVMNHMDEANDLSYSRKVIELGCFVQYDTFGSEWYFDPDKEWEPRDTERVDAVAQLCSEGFAERLTVSHDVFWKQHLRAFGGTGYDHILRSIVPMLEDRGVSEGDIDRILVRNPADILGIPGLER